MENWNHIQGQRQIIEPPPELPIYKVPSKSPHKEVAGDLSTRLKGGFPAAAEMMIGTRFLNI